MIRISKSQKAVADFKKRFFNHYFVNSFKEARHNKRLAVKLAIATVFAISGLFNLGSLLFTLVFSNVLDFLTIAGWIIIAFVVYLLIRFDPKSVHSKPRSSKADQETKPVIDPKIDQATKEPSFFKQSPELDLKFNKKNSNHPDSDAPAK